MSQELDCTGGIGRFRKLEKMRVVWGLGSCYPLIKLCWGNKLGGCLETQPRCGAKVLQGLYFPNRTFWQADKGSRPSWGWQSMLMGRESIANHVQWSVGTEENTNILEDRWLKRGLTGGPKNFKEPIKVAELIVQEKSRWDKQTLHKIFDEQIVNDILSVPLKTQTLQDKLVWTVTKSGEFTGKSAYNLLRAQGRNQSTTQASSSFQPSRKLWNELLEMKTPPKVRTFLWNVCQNALPTKDNPFRRKRITRPQAVPFCNQGAETIERPFLLYPWTAQIWEKPVLQVQISSYSVSRMGVWLQNFLEQRNYLPSFDVITVTLWCIWKARNDFVFRRQIPDPKALIDPTLNTLSMFSKWNPQETNFESCEQRVTSCLAPTEPRYPEDKYRRLPCGGFTDGSHRVHNPRRVGSE